MKYFILAWFAFALIINCAGPQKTTTDEPEKQPEEEYYYDESFDPVSLDDEDIVIDKEKPGIDAAPVETEPNKEAIEEPEIAFKETDGFRVQLLATTSIEKATLVQQTAMNQFEDLKRKTYLIFEAPHYKVRVGDALTRNDAEIIRDQARKLGYDEAFIVRSKVVVEEGAFE